MSVEKLKSLGIFVGNKTSGQVKTRCPKCSPSRKPANRKDPCLSVNLDEGVYNCHNCGWSGTTAEGRFRIPEWEYTGADKDSKWIKWLKKERGLSDEVIEHFKVQESTQYIQKDGMDVNCLSIPYMRHDSVVNIKYRSWKKGFKMESGAELIMFGMNEVSKSEDRINKAVITEGEFDAMSCWMAGYKHSLSVPNGASKGNNNLQYMENSSTELEKIDQFYLALDKDEAGESLLQELARRIGKDKCYIVSYPEGCKDANQVLTDHGVVELKKCLDNAKPMPIEGVVHASDCTDEMFRLYDNGIDRGDTLNVEGFDDLVSFKTSMLYIITGIPTHGKSSFLNWMEMMLVTQCHWKGAVFSPEHYPLGYLLYRYQEIILGKSFFRSQEERMDKNEMHYTLNYLNDSLYFIRPTDGMYTMQELLKIAKSMVLRYGIKFFTIDPWNTIKHDYTSGMTETQYIETALNELTIFKQVHDVAIFLVAHPKKMQKVRDQSDMNYGLYEVPSLYDISGSKSFYDKADVGITVYRNFNTNITTAYVQKIKFKHLGEVGMQAFQYKKGNSRFVAVSDDLQPLNVRDRNNAPLIPIQGAQQELANDWFNTMEDREEQFENQSNTNSEDDDPMKIGDDDLPF